MTSPHEIRALLRDCVILWGVAARVEVTGEGVEVIAADGRYVVTAAPPEM